MSEIPPDLFTLFANACETLRTYNAANAEVQRARKAFQEAVPEATPPNVQKQLVASDAAAVKAWYVAFKAHQTARLKLDAALVPHTP